MVHCHIFIVLSKLSTVILALEHDDRRAKSGLTTTTNHPNNAFHSPCERLKTRTLLRIVSLSLELMLLDLR